MIQNPTRRVAASFSNSINRTPQASPVIEAIGGKKRCQQPNR